MNFKIKLETSKTFYAEGWGKVGAASGSVSHLLLGEQVDTALSSPIKCKLGDA